MNQETTNTIKELNQTLNQIERDQETNEFEDSYATGYIAGTKDAIKELEKLDKRLSDIFNK